MKLKSLISLTIIGMAISVTPILSINKGSTIVEAVDEINEENIETSSYDLGVDYSLGASPAIYSRSYVDEPNYNSYQKITTFAATDQTYALDTYRGENVKVAIIDSGINWQHEDFYDESSNSVVEGDSKRITTSMTKYKYSVDPSKLLDTYGHGTNVAGVIASQINAVGCAGVAPNVDLYIYKIDALNSKGEVIYPWEPIKEALNECNSAGVDIINMSIQAYAEDHYYSDDTSKTKYIGGGESTRTMLTSYINSNYNRGAVIIAAAGNHDTEVLSYPASNDHVISVGALANGSKTSKASYSNKSQIDLVTSGTVYVPDYTGNSDYIQTQGTSFSAPIVTAAAALYKQKNPTATNDQIEAALYAACDPISGNPSWAGHGRLNISKLLGIDYPDGITLNNVEDEALTLEVGSTFDIDYTLTGTGSFSQEVTFENLDEDVLTVDENGHITAVGVGEDLIAVTSVQNPNVSVDILVTVAEKITDVSLNTYSLELEHSNSTTLTATTTPGSISGEYLRWETSDSSVVSLSSTTGKSVTVTAIGDPGESATISVSTTYGTTITKNCTVNIINEKALTSLTLENYNDTVIYPDKVRINLYYLDHYSFIKDIQMILCTVLGKRMEYNNEMI